MAEGTQAKPRLSRGKKAFLAVCLAILGIAVLVWLSPIVAISLSDYTEELPNGYYFYNESRDDRVITRQGWRKGDPYIACTVESYDHDGWFIVARQRVIDRCFVDGVNPIAELAGQELFWIIDTRSHWFFGPYETHAQFEMKRAALGIRATLDDPAN
jgi:hypothetical protein